MNFIGTLTGGKISLSKGRLILGKFADVVDRTRIVSESPAGFETVNDLTYETLAQLEAYEEATILNQGFISAPTYSVNDEAIATVDQSGNLTWVSDGTVRTKIIGGGAILTELVEVKKIVSDDQNIFHEWVTGCFLGHISEKVDSRIMGLDPVVTKPQFSTLDHSSRTFIRNPDCWLTVDSSGVSVSNSRSNGQRAGTLITQRHLLVAGHFPLSVGDVVWFTSDDGLNNTYSRTVLQTKRHPDYSNVYPDFTMCVLDSDLPSDIKFIKVAPSDIETRFSQIVDGRPAGVIITQDKLASVGGFSSMQASVTLLPPVRFPDDPGGNVENAELRQTFYQGAVQYDSGSFMGFIADVGEGDELVLSSVLSFNYFGYTGTHVAPFIADLNQLIFDVDALAGISTGYTVTEADLSSYPTY